MGKSRYILNIIHILKICYYSVLLYNMLYINFSYTYKSWNFIAKSHSLNSEQKSKRAKGFQLNSFLIWCRTILGLRETEMNKA